jgi:3'-phosphoadenosine 5'-phosphosulfate (PAPS) 3'-phosphatase
MEYGKKYGNLLEEIAEEADAIAMKYFRSSDLLPEKKGDGTVVTVADKAGCRSTYWGRRQARKFRRNRRAAGARG